MSKQQRLKAASAELSSVLERFNPASLTDVDRLHEAVERLEKELAKKENR